MKPRLVIIEGKDKGKVISLQNGSTVIGRSKGDILIHDPRISRSHVVIHFDQEEGKVTYTDLKSLNGTMVNGEIQEAGELNDGDRLQLGDTLFDCQVVMLGKEPSRLATRTNTSVRGEQIEPVQPSADAQLKNAARVQEPENRLAKEADRSVSILRKLYLRIPRRTRLYVLCFMGLTFSLCYLYLPSRDHDTGVEGSAVEAQVQAISLAQSQGRIDEGVRRAEELKTKYPDNSRVEQVLGDLYAFQGKMDLAIDHYRKSLQLTPPQNLSHVKLMRLYLVSGMKKDAEAENAEIEGILKDKLSREDLSPQAKEFFVGVAHLWLDFRDLDVPPKKMVVMGQALQNVIAPHDTVGLKLEAVGELLEGVPEDALKALQRARQKDPSDQTVLQYLVFAKVKLGDLNGASAIVKDWIEKFPEATQPLLIEAHWRFENKDYPGALPLLQRVVQLAAHSPLDPVLPEALFLMGKVYHEQGQAAEAELAFKQACDKGYSSACDPALISAVPSPAAPPNTNPTPPKSDGGPTPATAETPTPAPFSNGPAR